METESLQLMTLSINIHMKTRYRKQERKKHSEEKTNTYYKRALPRAWVFTGTTVVSLFPLFLFFFVS